MELEGIMLSEISQKIYTGCHSYVEYEETKQKDKTKPNKPQKYDCRAEVM